MVESTVTILANIDDYIVRNGLTKYGFEDLCHLSNGTLYNWYRGLAEPTLKSLANIAKYTGIPADRWLK